MNRVARFLASRIDHWWGMLLALAIPIFIAFLPVLVGGKIFSEQPFWDSLPHYVWYQQAIQSGESFLWNPLNFSGFPSFTGIVGFFSPIHYFAFQFFPVIPAFHWLIAIYFALAAFFTALFLKDLGVSPPGAYLGGLGYGLSQIVYIASLTMASTVPFLPMLFWTLSRLSRAPWMYGAIGVFIVALGWLAGVTQYVLYAFLAACAFVAFLGWRDRRALLAGVAVLAIGTAIGLVQLAPQALLAQFSTRAGGLSYAVASEDPVLPTDAVRLFLPFFEPPLGIPFGSSGAEPFMYLGIVPLFFSLAAFSGRAPLTRFFLGLLLGALALSVVYSPFFWALAHLPVFNYFRVPSRWMMVGLFAASVLAGLGYETIRNSSPGRWARFLLRAFFSALIAAAGAVGGLFAAFGFFGDATERFFERIAASFLGTSPEFFSPFHRELIGRVLARVRELVALERPEVFLPLGMLAAGTLILWLFVRRAGHGAIAPWLALFTALNFVAIAPLSYATLPRRLATDPAPTVRFLKAEMASGDEASVGRAYGFLTDRYFDEQVPGAAANRGRAEGEFQAATLLINVNLYFGIPSAGYFDQLRSRAMSDLLALLGDPSSGGSGDPSYGSDLRELPSADAVRLLATRKPLLDFLGIRYVISGYPLDEKKFPKVFSAALTERNIPIAVYENREAGPPAYFAREVEFVSAGRENVLGRFRQRGFRGIFASCSEPCPAGNRRYGMGSLELVERRNASFRVRTALPEPGFLVVSQNHLPGWHAELDGATVAISTVNTVFMGVAVPAGTHELTFEYRYPCPPREILRCIGTVSPAS